MKNKKQFTLIELIIVIVVIGILAAMALPKFNGVVRNAKLSAMINDKEVLEKALIMYYQKNDELPLLNEDQELIVSNDLRLTKIVLAEEVQSSDMDTIYKSLKETLTYYNDSEDTLYRIDLSKIKDSLSKDIKYGHKKHNKDFYVYSIKTGNVYYYDYLVNGNGTIQHTEYDTLLKDNELVNKTISPSLNGSFNNDNNIVIQENIINLSIYSSMAINKDGNLYSWGKNDYGQLGIGNTINQSIPQLVEFPNKIKIKKIFSYAYMSVVLTKNNELYSWGINTYGQLGIGNTTNQSTPQLIEFPKGVYPIDVSTSDSSTLAIGNDNNLYVWGYNGYGALGTGDTLSHSTPYLVSLPNGVKPKSVYTSRYYYSIVLGDDGNLYSCGGSGWGKLGIGNAETFVKEFKKINFPNDVKPQKIVLGEYNSMVIGDDGNLYAWGYNKYGQLGTYDTTDVFSPKKISLPNQEKPMSIYLGENHSMVLTDKGNLYASGKNDFRQLGVENNLYTYSFRKVLLPEGTEVKDVILGGDYSIVQTKDLKIYSWGNNKYGQLGNSNLSLFKPELYSYFDDNNIKIKSILTQYNRTIFIAEDGSIFSCGLNNYGVQGNGIMGDNGSGCQYIPTKIELP